MIVPSRATPLFVVALAGLFLIAPARAQEGGLEGNFRTGTHSFRRILFEKKFEALDDWRKLDVAPNRTLLVVLGNPKLDNITGGLEAFIRAGGAALIATDQTLDTEELRRLTGHTVSGTKVAAWPPRRHDLRGKVGGRASEVDAKFIYRGIPPGDPSRALFECLIVQPVNRGGPPLFLNPNRRLGQFGEPIQLVTNRPSYLRPRNEVQGAHVLAEFPRGCWFGDFLEFLPPDWPVPQFAVSAQHGNGQILLLADHSVFINEMMKEMDNNNVEFAINAVNWLKDDRRDRVLFVEDGVIRTNLNVPLREDVLPVDEFERFLADVIEEALLEEQENHRRTNELNKVGMDVANEALGATIFSRSRPENFFLFLLILSIIVLVLWSLRRIRSACHKQDALVPLLSAAVKRQAPHLPVPRLRQKYAIQEDALWDSGREIARDWLNSLPGLPPPEYEAPGKPPRRPRLDPRAGVFHARKHELLFQRVWQLAWSEVPRRMSEWELRMMLVQMEQFQEALEAGDIRFAQPGEREPLGRASSRRR